MLFAIQEALKLNNFNNQTNQYFFIEKSKKQNSSENKNFKIEKEKKIESIEIELLDTEDNSIKKNNYLSKKKQRNEENYIFLNNKKEKEKKLIFIIQKYFIYIYELIETQKMEILEKEKNCLMKILDYLSEYVPENPFSYLNETNICKMILYFSDNLHCDINFNSKIKEVKKNLDKMFLSELFKQNN